MKSPQVIQTLQQKQRSVLNHKHNEETIPDTQNTVSLHKRTVGVKSPSQVVALSSATNNNKISNSNSNTSRYETHVPNIYPTTRILSKDKCNQNVIWLVDAGTVQTQYISYFPYQCR